MEGGCAWARHSGRQDTTCSRGGCERAYPGGRALPEAVIPSLTLTPKLPLPTFQCHMNSAFDPIIPAVCLLERLPTELSQSGCPSALSPRHPPPTPGGRAPPCKSWKFKTSVTADAWQPEKQRRRVLPSSQNSAVPVSLNHMLVQLQNSWLCPLHPLSKAVSQAPDFPGEPQDLWWEAPG